MKDAKGREIVSPLDMTREQIDGSVFDRCVKIDWPALWRAVGTRDVHRAECDDREGVLSVCADDQGDLHAAMYPHPMARECGGGFGSPTFRARTLAGGGRCERIRAALALLALAIAEDQPNATGQRSAAQGETK